LSGFEAVSASLKALEPKVARQIANPAVKEAANAFKAAVKARAPVRTGKMMHSIRVKSSKGPLGFTRGSVAWAVITGEAMGPTWYTFLIEKGFHSGVRHRSGQITTGYSAHAGNLGAKGVKYTPGKLFIKKAMRGVEPGIRTALLTKLWNGIERIVQASGVKTWDRA
jgi:HK97 gp10 family phage protein